MNTKQTEALKLALEALEESLGYVEEEAENAQRLYGQYPTRQARIQGLKDDARKHMNAITTIREALAEQPAQQECNYCGGTGDVSGEYPGVACPECSGSGVQAQPEFIKHEVENAYDWSEWVCPDPESYLMKCCDCGLVHEAQFRVAKYKPAPSDECQVVSDPDLQAQFRMRRSEQWSPKDMAYRPGGLPLAEQPAQQQEPVATVTSESGNPNVLMSWWHEPALPVGTKIYTSPHRKPLTDEEMFKIAEIAWRHGWASCRDAEYVGEEAEDERWGMVGAEVVQDIAAHGIGEKPDAA